MKSLFEFYVEFVVASVVGVLALATAAGVLLFIGWAGYVIFAPLFQ